NPLLRGQLKGSERRMGLALSQPLLPEPRTVPPHKRLKAFTTGGMTTRCDGGRGAAASQLPTDFLDLLAQGALDLIGIPLSTRYAADIGWVHAQVLCDPHV